MAALLAHAAAILVLGAVYLPAQLSRHRPISVDPGFRLEESTEKKIEDMTENSIPREFAELPNALKRPRGPEMPFPWKEEGLIDGTAGKQPVYTPGPRIDPWDFNAPLSPKPSRADVLGWFGARLDETRKAETRKKLGVETAGAVLARGLAWLASVQSADGAFEPEPFGGAPHFETGITGLALLAFLGDGNTLTRGRFAGNVERAVAHLLDVQDHESGRFGPETGNYMYNHGIALLAMAEAYGLALTEPPSKRPDLGTLVAAVRKGVRYLLDTQSGSGGWGYSARDGNSDSSVTAWPVAALSTALRLKITPPDRSGEVKKALYRAARWFRHVTHCSGAVGYRKPGEYKTGPHSLTAVSLYCRGLFLEGVTPSGKGMLRKQIELVSRATPSKAEKADYYFWYYASFGLRHAGSSEFRGFYRDLTRVLNDRQKPEGDFTRHSEYGDYGGSMYTTSMALLALEAPYRYPVR